MKKIAIMSLILFGTFILSGCDQIPEEVEDLLPAIELAGDSIMVVELGSEFVDPGAVVIGDFELDITTESNLDVFTLGTYEITYTIEYIGITYDIVRTINVVDSVLLDLDIEISLIEVTTTSAKFNVTINDPSGILQSPMISLYSNESIVEAITFGDGENIIEFTGFTPETFYRVQLEGTYIINDITKSLSGYYIEFWTPEEAVVVLPELELVGAATINVELYSAFVDPGAIIIGDFDLEIEVESYVDTITLGTYTVTYSIVYEDITYSISRTVEVIEISTLIPYLELVGAATINVELYSAFVDPGAIVVGDNSLNISVESNVDTSTVGTYTITYSIIFNEITYSITRTVDVSLPQFTEHDFIISVSYDNLTRTSVSVLVMLTDPDGILVNGHLVIYDGTNLVGSLDISDGTNYLEFINLSPDTNYRIELEGEYTENGILKYIETHSFEILTLPPAILSVEVLTYTVGTTSIYTIIEVVDTDWIITTITASLFQDDTLVETRDMLVGGNYFTFEDLDSGTAYYIVVDYAYTPIGETSSFLYQTTILEFTTQEVPVVTLELSNCSIDITSIDCVLDFNYPGLSNVYIYAELWSGDVWIKNIDVADLNSSLIIEDLDDNTEYTIKFYAEYTNVVTSEEYFYMFIDSLSFTTLELVAYTAPTVDNVVVTTIANETTTSITIEFDLIDSDSTITSNQYLRLYRGGSQTIRDITVGHNVIVFEGYPVYENTVYTIKITTDYLVNVTTTEYEAVLHEIDITTPVDIRPINFEQEEMFFQGDQIILILELDNDEELEIEFVTINGDQYSDFLFPSTNKLLYISMGIETDVATYSYNLENVGVYLIDEVGYYALMDETVEMRLEVEGTIVPDDSFINILEVTTDNYFESYSEDYADYVNLYLHFDNKYNLEITSIEVNGTEYTNAQFELLSSTLIKVIVEHPGRSSKFYLNKVTFTRNSEDVIADYGYIYFVEIYGYLPEDVVHISTAEQLQAIGSENNKYYILDNDIDLNGIDFTPIGTYDDSFGGAFNGNGYTIYNLNITSSLDEQESYTYVGLFGYSYAYIADVHIHNSTINIVTNEDYYIYAGTLAGYHTGDIYNVEITGTNIITVSGMIKGDIGGLIGYSQSMIRNAYADVDIVIDGLDYSNVSYQVSVGGLIGRQNAENVESSSAHGSITITNTNDVAYLVGGLVGNLTNGGSAYAVTNFIMNSYATGDISTTNTYYGATGGLLGKTGNVYTTSAILNSYATGDVFASAGDVAGLAGYGYALITNSFATGNVMSLHSIPGRLVDTGSTYLLINTYKYDNQILLFDGVALENGSDTYQYTAITASSVQYNDIYFYLKHLGWNSYFFNFNTLDVENDDLPTHN